jgi:CubicO group peptidase (beta-lactamase class C family)
MFLRSLLFSTLTSVFGSDAVVANEDTFVPGLWEPVQARIEGDRSGVCVRMARIELDAKPEVTTSDECAQRRADRPAGNARFEIGSISKVFVGVLIADMVERGEMKLDEPLEALVPKGTATPVTALRPITLAELLTHTSGLPALPVLFRPQAGLANPYADVTPDVIYGSLGRVTLKGTPPQPYSYSNWAFMLLSDAAARRAGKSFDVLLRERVLAPLGLDDTVVASGERVVRGRTSYGAATPNWDFPVNFAGVGGIRSTLDDMVLFARAMLGDVPDSAPATLRRALVVSRTRLTTINDALDLGYAWHLLKKPGAPQITFHNGMTGGFSAALALDIAHRRAGVVLADAFGGFDDLALRALDPKAPLAPPRRTAELDLVAAEQAAGRYQLAPGMVLTVSLEENRLYAQATGQARFELLQDSRGDYYTTATEMLIRFRRDPSARATGLTLFQGGGAVPGNRLD